MANTPLLILLATTMSCGHSRQVFDIKEPYRGFIVNQDTEIYIGNKVDWFEPTLEEVREAEHLLGKQIKRLNSNRVNQNGSCPIVDKNLDKYLRQYVGYVNISGEKVILINMLWQDKIEDYKGLRSELAMMFDGCSHYWKIQVNLTSSAVYDLEVNGST